MSTNAIVYKSVLAKKLTDFMEADQEADDSVADVAMRNAVLDCLSLLAQKGTEHVKELIASDHPFHVLDMLLVGLMNETNMFMLLIGQVVARGRNWWKLQIAMVSNLELRLLWIVEMMDTFEATSEEKAAPDEHCEGEDAAEVNKHVEAKEAFEAEK